MVESSIKSGQRKFVDPEEEDIIGESIKLIDSMNASSTKKSKSNSMSRSKNQSMPTTKKDDDNDFERDEDVDYSNEFIAESI